MLCRRRLSLPVVVVLFLGVVSRPAAAQPAGQTGTTAEAAKTLPRPDPFQVPEGGVDELLKYLEELGKLQPSSSLRPVDAEFRRKRAVAQLTACERILAARPGMEQARVAIRAKIAALVQLGRLGDETAHPRIEATVQQVKGLNLPELVRETRFAVLDVLVRDAARAQGSEFAGLVERLDAFLREGPIDGPSARLAVDLAMAAEQSNRPDAALAAHRQLGKTLAASKDETVLATSATMLGAARRLGLIGKPLLLEGSTVGGKALDWKSYRGRIVLVDFFATWCGPCREEAPGIAKCYRAYRKRGFDVVAVSIDRDRKTLEEFLEKEKYPWVVILDRNEARGTNKSLATYYGIFAVPQRILVDKEGRVIALDVRGDRLARLLEELLGPAKDEKPRPAPVGK